MSLLIVLSLDFESVELGGNYLLSFNKLNI